MTAISLPRLLVLIGSGETGPQMTRVHRSIIKRLAGPNGGAADVTAVVVDTPFGFQENADELSAHLVDYFGRRLGMRASLASYRRAGVGLYDRETARARIRDAAFVFSGPGSPSYAIRQWQDGTIGELFAQRIMEGGALVFASAAALTSGRFAVPVYEIYKAGADPYWLPGLDLLGSIGIAAAVIPHFDNREGGGHDTRYCFLGERRLRTLEELLPEDVHILGIDEHTALVLDIDAQRAVVHGSGVITLRRGGVAREFAAGSEFPMGELQARGAGSPTLTTQVATRAPARTHDEREETSFVRRALELEGQVSLLAARAEKVEPLVDALIELRRLARDRGDYQTADSIRERLAAVGVELRDSAQGSVAYPRGDKSRQSG